MPTDPRNKLNLLWICLDQIRYDTLGCNGNPVCRTPNADRLARGGVSFDRAYTPSSLCTPARASMLTGRFAFAHGMLTNCDMYHSVAAELPRPEMLLHPRLQREGYACGFVGKWHVGTRKGPADYGFEGMSVPGYGNILANEEYNAYLRDRDLSYRITDRIYANPGEKTLLAGRWDGPAESTPPYYLAERARGMLAEYARADRPFMLCLNFWGPHQPCLPSREYAGSSDRSAIEPWGNFEDALTDKPAALRRTARDFYRAMPEGWEGWREIVGLYYDFASMIDAQVGRVLDALEELGLADNTVVVLTTDHGDLTGSHGGLNDKGVLYEEAHHIPLIVSSPGRFRRGSRSDELVYNMDVLPTMLDLLGQPDRSLHGRSLLPVLRGEPLPDARQGLLLEFHGIRYLYSQRGLLTRDGWKYIFTPGDFDEAYDLNSDPGEMHNLVDSPEQAERIDALRKQLIELTAEADDPLHPCVRKFFGDWGGPATQPDPTRI